jgi:hypothetical protein
MIVSVCSIVIIACAAGLLGSTAETSAGIGTVLFGGY